MLGNTRLNTEEVLWGVARHFTSDHGCVFCPCVSLARPADTLEDGAWRDQITTIASTCICLSIFAAPVVTVDLSVCLAVCVNGWMNG